jgi:hypothetical protein
MPTTVKFRRANVSANNGFTGSAGEITIDETNWNLRIHDGTTAGGHIVGGGGGGAVSQIVAGSGISITPSNGVGTVTINSTGGSGGAFSGTLGNVSADPSTETINFWCTNFNIHYGYVDYLGNPSRRVASFQGDGNFAIYDVESGYHQGYGGFGTAVFSAETYPTANASDHLRSDRNDKENIVPTAINGMDVVLKLQVVDFKWREGLRENDGETHTGLIAQDVKALVPDAVWAITHPPYGDPAKPAYKLNKAEIVPSLIKAFQELKAEKDSEIAALKADIQLLKSKLGI